MKRNKAITIMICTAILLTGCGRKPSEADLKVQESDKTKYMPETVIETGEEEDDATVKVVCSMFPYSKIVEDVTRGFSGTMDITLLVQPYSTDETYIPTVEDLNKVREADIIVYNGGDIDSFMNDILNVVDIKDKQVINCTNVVETDTSGFTITKKNVVGSTLEDGTCYGVVGADESGVSFTDEEQQEIERFNTDERIWNSTKNLVCITTRIGDVLEKEVSAERWESIEVNLESYISELKSLYATELEIANRYKRPYAIFCDAMDIRYFFNEAGVECTATFNERYKECEQPNAVTQGYILSQISENGVLSAGYLREEENVTLSLLSSSINKVKMYDYAVLTKEEVESEKAITGYVRDNVSALSSIVCERIH